MEYDHVVKLLVVGTSGVGKTCIKSRFCDNEFTDSYQSHSYDFKSHIINIDDVRIKVMIWEIPRIDPMRECMSKYFRGYHGLIIVYDITDFASFCQAEDWVTTIKRYANDNIMFTLLGNKSDLSSKRCISYEDGKSKANNFGCSFFETSAKTGLNVDSMFEVFAKSIYETSACVKNDTITLTKQTPKSKCF